MGWSGDLWQWGMYSALRGEMLGRGPWWNTHHTAYSNRDNLIWRISNRVLEDIRDTLMYFRDRKCRKQLLSTGVEGQREKVGFDIGSLGKSWSRVPVQMVLVSLRASMKLVLGCEENLQTRTSCCCIRSVARIIPTGMSGANFIMRGIMCVASLSYVNVKTLDSPCIGKRCNRIFKNFLWLIRFQKETQRLLVGSECKTSCSSCWALTLEKSAFKSVVLTNVCCHESTPESPVGDSLWENLLVIQAGQKEEFQQNTQVRLKNLWTHPLSCFCHSFRTTAEYVSENERALNSESPSISFGCVGIWPSKDIT